MGSSHHALEDYGSLLTLPHMRAFVPAFDSDVSTMIPTLMQSNGPVYLRLGLSEEPKGWQVPPYAPWRKLLERQGFGPSWSWATPGRYVDCIATISRSRSPRSVAGNRVADHSGSSSVHR